MSSFCQRYNLSLWWFGKVALALIFLWNYATLALANGCRESSSEEDFKNQRRTVRVIVDRPKDPHTYYGSGVLISPQGYILTARHVINPTIDFSIDGKDTEIWREGSSIKIKFYNGFEHEELSEFQARWTKTWPDYDLAVLKLQSVDDEIRRRNSPTLFPLAGFAGKCFEILGATPWSEELKQGELGPDQLKYEHLSAELMEGIDNWRVSIRTNVAEGFSGGPVFYPDDEWYLVGIITRSRVDRDSTKIMRDIGSVIEALQKEIPDLRVRSSRPFPSAAIQNFTKLQFDRVSTRQREMFVRSIMQNKGKGTEFVGLMFQEDFTSSGDPRQTNLAVIGRDMLDTTASIMFQDKKLMWEPDLFSRLTEKIITAWESIRRGNFNRILVSRLAQDTDFYDRYCSQSKSTPGLVDCLKRLSSKRYTLWQKIKANYDKAWTEFQQSDENDPEKLLYWASQMTLGLQQWGDSLVKISDYIDRDILSSASDSQNELPYLGGMEQPKTETNPPKKIVYLASAVDKFLKGIITYSEVSADQNLQVILKGTTPKVSQYKNMARQLTQSKLNLCDKSVNTLERLNNNLDKNEFSQNKYSATVNEYLAKLKFSRCGQIVKAKH